jgi:hypothetical protein
MSWFSWSKKRDEKNVTRGELDETLRNTWARDRKFDSLCELLGIGFTGGDYEEKACYVIKDKSDKKG